jgi:hypothetical protein
MLPLESGRTARLLGIDLHKPEGTPSHFLNSQVSGTIMPHVEVFDGGLSAVGSNR